MTTLVVLVAVSSRRNISSNTLAIMETPTRLMISLQTLSLCSKLVPSLEPSGAHPSARTLGGDGHYSFSPLFSPWALCVFAYQYIRDALAYSYLDSSNYRWRISRPRIHLRRSSRRRSRNRRHFGRGASLCLGMLSKGGSWPHNRSLPDHGGNWCHAELLDQS
jgi:hypothetical protein